jgi:soluble lytic murein transglycosylase-like protein
MIHVWCRNCLVLGLTLGAFISLAGGSARASNIRSYTDAQGVVHLTNTRSKHAIRPGAAGGAASTTWVPQPLLDAVIAESADFYRIPRALVKAVIATESNYNPWAISERGAIGLMQLMPGTARDMYVADPFDPVQNIRGGVRYLRVLVNAFDGDLLRVLAAYNAGPEAVRRSTRSETGVPPIPETVEYVRRVMEHYQAYRTTERS